MKIAIATGSGNCPGLNAVIRAVAQAAAKRGWETLGILGGYAGLLEPQRVVPPGYHNPGGLPRCFDHVLCSSFGAHAVERIAEGSFGRMLAWQGPQITDIPLADAVGRLKTVPLDSNLVRTACAPGISLGG